MGNEDFLFRGAREQSDVFQGNSGIGTSREGLIHAVIISPCIRKKLQLTFYANETTSLSRRKAYEPRHEKTCLRGLRPVKTPTGLLS